MRPEEDLPAVPPPVVWTGEVPRPATVQARREALDAQGRQALERVDDLARRHETLGAELAAGLGRLGQRGRAVQTLEMAPQGGLLASLVRRLTARRDALERRSATAALVSEYEAVQLALRRAAAFADELELCAVELQGQVDDLHEQRLVALSDSKRSAERILAIEAALDAVPDAHPEAARRRDQLTFELRAESGRLALLEATAAACAEQLEPARRLRDTVQDLHEETAAFVLNAAGTVNEAGRTVQALGVAADAPLVVAELQGALDRLELAMAESEAVVGQARHLLADVLPDLNARLSARDETRRAVLTSELDAIDRERAHAMAEQALRAAAAAEVEAALEGR